MCKKWVAGEASSLTNESISAVRSVYDGFYQRIRRKSRCTLFTACPSLPDRRPSPSESDPVVEMEGPQNTREKRKWPYDVNHRLKYFSFRYFLSRVGVRGFIKLPNLKNSESLESLFWQFDNFQCGTESSRTERTGKTTNVMKMDYYSEDDLTGWVCRQRCIDFGFRVTEGVDRWIKD